MHIGLIGGIGPAATEFYYRGLVGSNPTTSRPLELTIAHADMAALLANMADDKRREQAKIFCRHVEQLAGAGAVIAAVTSIAGHFCFQDLEAISPLPLVSALKALGQELERRKFRRVGLLGSKSAMVSKFYGMEMSAEVVLPQDDELASVSQEYFAMAIAQRATQAQKELFFKAGARLCSEQGAELVVLAGTDMFLAFADEQPGFEVIDSAEVHIKALSELARSPEPT